MSCIFGRKRYNDKKAVEELPKDKYFKIGEVVEEKGFSIQTLRYYDKIGLIKPKYIDPETNYRYYSGTQFYKLEIIKYCCGELMIMTLTNGTNFSLICLNPCAAELTSSISRSHALIR